MQDTGLIIECEFCTQMVEMAESDPFVLSLISGFHRDVDEICALPETSVNNYRTTPPNISEKRRSEIIF
jgi:hypothetical protein